MVVASAGNDGRGAVEFPATLPNVIAVGGVDGRKQRAPYSNFGPELDVVAPGGDGDRDDDDDGLPDVVFQQMPSTRHFIFVGRFDDFCYCGLEGTSLATPHVAAAGRPALRAGDRRRAAVQAALEQTAEDLGATGRDDQFGHGLIRPSQGPLGPRSQPVKAAKCA